MVSVSYREICGIGIFVIIFTTKFIFEVPETTASNNLIIIISSLLAIFSLSLCESDKEKRVEQV
jgi:hypothetical protein